jgi:hypothetical protein
MGWVADCCGTSESFLTYGAFMLPLCGMLALIMRGLRRPGIGDAPGE